MIMIVPATLAAYFWGIDAFVRECGVLAGGGGDQCVGWAGGWGPGEQEGTCSGGEEGGVVVGFTWNALVQSIT